MTPLETYLARGIDQIEGWLDAYSARFIADLLAGQRAAGIDGAFGEIGVHHGRLFVLLHLAAAGAPGFAIDIFGDQHLNADGSGHGDRARFERNLGRWSSQAGPVTIFQRSSLDIAAAEILEAVGPCRFVSIDGGHTEECTLSDLRLADAVLHDHGIAVLDDCFNEHWPDVASGAARYCLDPATRLRPFAITPNKVYFARPAGHAAVLARLGAAHAPHLLRQSRMFGSDVNVYQSRSGIPPSPQALDEMLGHVARHPGRVLRHVVSRSPIGPVAIRMRDALRRRTQ